MDESKKLLIPVIIVWGILAIAMNFIIPEQYPAWYIRVWEGRLMPHKISNNLIVGAIILLFLILFFLPKSKHQKKEEFKKNV